MTPTARLSVAGAATTAALAVALVVVGGRLAGEAREPAHDGASRFMRADAEAAARSACRSKAPFVVLDTFAHFKPANIDDDLDEPGEGARTRILHGDVVAAIVEASHPGAVAYQTDPVFNVRTLAADFGRLAGDIENGRLAKPAAVMSSIVLPVDLREINSRLPRADPFQPADVARRRAELLHVITGGHARGNPYAEIDGQLARLKKAGVPVFVAAGNTAPDQAINALALSDGVYAVGALDRDGAATAYTSMPSFVSIWSPGYVVLTEAPGGLSVSGGRKVELKGADLPGQRAVIAAYAGRRAKDVVRSVPDQLKYMSAFAPSRGRNRYVGLALPPGLYRTEDLMAAYGHSAKLGTFARALAEGPYMHYPSDTIFRADADGALAFDPIGDRSGGQLQVYDATSFAVPNLCATKLFESRYAGG